MHINLILSRKTEYVEKYPEVNNFGIAHAFLLSSGKDFQVIERECNELCVHV